MRIVAGGEILSAVRGSVSSVNRAIPFFSGLVAAIVVFAASGAQASGSTQTLGIVMKHNAAATERLPFYRATSPIAVNVRGSAALSHMTITAHAPDGSAFSTPLVRTADGFTGALRLTQPGTWSVALTTQFGSMSTALAAVPLEVVADDNADLAARFAYALSALSIGAGLTLLVRARRIPLRT
jgi:hypothetical protein